jgi:hypothetical protein
MPIDFLVATGPKLTPQEPVFFKKVPDNFPLPAVQPASQRHQHDL